MTVWAPNWALIEHQDFKCIVMDAPAAGHEANWLEPLQKHDVKTIVCTAEGQYDKKLFAEKGVEVVDLLFADGTEPPDSVIAEWLSLAKKSIREHRCLCVHCLAGLGRAPALVALCLIEQGMDPTDAILHVREQRRGAISARQVKFLQNYKPRGALGKPAMCACAVM